LNGQRADQSITAQRALINRSDEAISVEGAAGTLRPLIQSESPAELMV